MSEHPMTADFKKLYEGKTKLILEYGPTTVLLVSKSDITAGDGLKKLVLPGKDCLANTMAVNVFKFLNHLGVPTHFIEKDKDISFLAHRCKMIPLEVVVRRYADGSYLKRNPMISRGKYFPHPVVEFYYKDDARHDPMILLADNNIFTQGNEPWTLVDAKSPEGACLGQIQPLVSDVAMNQMSAWATIILCLLEQVLEPLNFKLWDLKIEFGNRVDNGSLVLADVITIDEWRLTDAAGNHIDKQPFRDGTKTIEELVAIYERGAEVTGLLMQKYLDLSGV